ncbi:hypothetical protein C8Q80DRAFT_1198414 [Daedaleopsis nitida]|nr:hypothetical protein C8Q80DRAFT_1198414 [Daedaleopsis nitida]
MENGSNDGNVTLPSRKRARKENESSSKPQRNKGARLVGKLTKLIDMPLDVFYEIASHLHPLDLLHMMRTSKMLRFILRSRTSTSVWRAAFTTIDSFMQMPPVPPGMSEPRFAALLFDRFCFLCSGDRANWVDYAIQLRLCKVCSKTNIRTGNAILGRRSPLLTCGILRVVPCETTDDRHVAQKLLDPSSHVPTRKYYVKDVDETVKEWRAIKSAGKSVQELEERMQLRQLSGFTVLLWMHSISLEKQLDDISTSKTRSESITAKLQKLGYAQQDFPEDDATWDRLVNQPKPLTDRIWNNLRPKLEARIALARDRRIEEELNERIDVRLDQILDFFDQYLQEDVPEKERGLVPNDLDFCELPSIAALARRDDAQGHVSRADFSAVTEQMLIDIAAYKTQAKEMLLASFRKDDGHPHSMRSLLEGLSADEAFSRCFAYFSCCSDECDDRLSYATYAECHAHWREEHPDEAWMSEHPYRKGWRLIEFTYDVPEVARAVLMTNEIPLDTTQEVLDRWVREGRLYCSCGDPDMPAPGELSFAKLLEHLVHYQRYDWRRIFKMKKTPNPNYVLKATHIISEAHCDVKFLAEGADTTPAFARQTISPALRATIEERIAARPDAERPLVCRICKSMHKKSRDAHNSRLPDGPEAIVWHLRRCHQRDFEKRDIVFA